MANEPYTITNQKLYFAKQALTDWQALEKAPHSNKMLLKAYQERVIFHLYSSLWACYNEIATYYRFPLMIQSYALDIFLSKEFLEQYPSPELNELALLLNTSNSVVASVNKAWSALFTPVTQLKQQADVNRIQVNNMDTTLNVELLSVYLQEITELILHFRSGLTEY